MRRVGATTGKAGMPGYSVLQRRVFILSKTPARPVCPEVSSEKKSYQGILVVDPYNAYNKAPVQIQYCYAHLLRDVEKLEKDFPESAEIKAFVSTLVPLLAQAMHLRTQPISDEQYDRQAQEIRQKIIKVSQHPAQHLAIRTMQDLFHGHGHRPHHWVQDWRVPPDNNLAERDLRPTVIARKVSFGSSSDAGAKTRSILMSVLHPLNKRCGDQSLESIFKNLLDEITKNPKGRVASLFPAPKSNPHT